MDTSEFRHDLSVYPGALCENMGDSPNLMVGFSPVLDQDDPLILVPLGCGHFVAMKTPLDQ